MWILYMLFVGLLAFFGITALGSVLYVFDDVDRDRKPFWSIWWDYFSHVALFRR